MNIPHADLIRAVLDGKTLQYLNAGGVDWVALDAPQVIRLLLEYPHWQFRIKPEPHKWQREMDAQAAGKAVQFRRKGGEWLNSCWKLHFNDENFEYRVKPEPVTKKQANNALNVLSLNSKNYRGKSGTYSEEVLRRFIEESPHPIKLQGLL